MLACSQWHDPYQTAATVSLLKCAGCAQRTAQEAVERLAERRTQVAISVRPCRHGHDRELILVRCFESRVAISTTMR